MTESLSFLWVDGRSALADPRLVEEWALLVRGNPNPTSTFASPEWLAHLGATRPRPIGLLCVRGEGGDLRGVVPVLEGRYDLTFAVAGRTLARKRFSACHLLGSVPVLPANNEAHLEALRCIFLHVPSCEAIYADSVPADSFFWSFLTSSRGPRRDVWPYMLDAPRPWHGLRLAPSFEAYLKGMSRKARANIRREMRKLAEFAGGDLRFLKVANPEEVGDFLPRAEDVSRRSWQSRVVGPRVQASRDAVESLKDLAERRLLRSYLLMAGSRPVAFAIGYQHGGTYSYVETAYDEELQELSPGKLLLYLVIEDLHASDSPRLLDFGVGDAPYKSRFGNLEGRDSSFLILRRGGLKRLPLLVHKAFGRGLGVARRLLRRGRGEL